MLQLSTPGSDDESRDKGAELALWLLHHEDLPIRIRVHCNIIRACYGEGNPVWHAEEATRVMEAALVDRVPGEAERKLLQNARDSIAIAKELAAEMAAMSSDSESEEEEAEDEEAEAKEDNEEDLSLIHI